MTNEELALDILANNKVLRTQTPPIRGEIRDALIELANKKDQQFKEYLEKKKDNYVHRREMWQQDTFEWGCYDSQIDAIDEIINKFFNKE